MLSRYNLTPGEKVRMPINEDLLESGVYLYKVRIDGELKASDKLVIIK